MTLEFDIKGYADTWLTPVIYLVQIVWCLVVVFPFVFVIRCWRKFPWIRNLRTAFTMYLSGMDTASRLIFFSYYTLRLYTIYHDDLRMIETDQGDQSVVNAHSCPNGGCGDTLNTIFRTSCLKYSTILFSASTWPMTSVFLVQIHALLASVFPSRYSRIANLKFSCITMIAAFLIDLCTGVLAHDELERDYVLGEEPEIMDACKFEYFSRLSLISSWYVLIVLVCIGVVVLIQLGLCYAHRRRNRLNPVANSPVHGWAKMTANEKRLTTIIMISSIVSFVLFLVHFIVYLIEGNSLLREILSITISVFGFFGPVEMMWFNIDLRKAVFILVFGDSDQKLPDRSDHNA